MVEISWKEHNCRCRHSGHISQQHLFASMYVCVIYFDARHFFADSITSSLTSWLCPPVRPSLDSFQKLQPKGESGGSSSSGISHDDDSSSGGNRIAAVFSHTDFSCTGDDDCFKARHLKGEFKNFKVWTPPIQRSKTIFIGPINLVMQSTV